MASLGLGTDISCTDDIDPTFRLVSGQRCLAEALYRRLITPRGTLLGDPEYGFDLRGLLNDDELSPFQVGAGVEAELRKDPRVREVLVEVVADAVAKSLHLTITVTDESGPFLLVLEVTDMSIELLELPD